MNVFIVKINYINQTYANLIFAGEVPNPSSDT